MSLLQLPPEILRSIFDQIRPSFFGNDLGRLTVCKQWFQFALPAYFKAVTVTPKTLRSLVASGAIAHDPSPLSGFTETLLLQLKGVSETTTTLYDELAQLAIVAGKSQRLRYLYILSWPFDFSVSGSPDSLWHGLPLATMRSFFSAENLAELVLDLVGISLDSPSAQQQGDDCQHLCPFIGSRLRNLRVLHVRMRSICPEVLELADSDRDSKPLPLRVVVINLSLIDNWCGRQAGHSERCGSRAGRGGGNLDSSPLMTEMATQAKALGMRAAAPEAVRILTHRHPMLPKAFKTQSLDVLTGKTMMLDDDAGWGEDGETVQEDSESESEITDDES
ncbi:hypothetical protein GGR56DRAFT_619767 [Xylariaceae sp. FL0804]|nr:hypothetical protein GGR56DRAFT_619767 [Xylariaceae sp. FL0804]